ncbi:MAG: hypothetical protein B6242_16530 [Anaerolineaceae bacterium 4572_78]|nr:MAG: hypothetical protein B6242_16530 [Anaerolineaceae bacterium 4572_78]
MDVFYIKVNRNGRLGDVQNMGYPINTNKDDFAFMLNKYSSEGYFSSNRDGGKGDDDIYSFELLKPFEFTKLLRGTSLEQDGDTIPFAFISLYSEEGVLIDSVMSDSIGAYEFVVLADKLYTLKGEKASYFDGRNSADTHVDEEIIIVDLVLLQDIKVLAEIIEINPIYFDFDKSNIRPDAAIELDKIVEVMNKYDSLVVELGSHTDCRGSKAYNEQLSDRRAKSSAKYIKARITNPERITGKGYGEYRLLNGCECEGDVQSDCSKEDHQMNRRTEFRVIKEGAHKVKIETKGPNSFDEIETPEE